MNCRSSIFLIEIMIAILLFSLTGALCLRMFAKSRRLDDTAQATAMAASQAQNAMELMRHSASPDSSGQLSETDFWGDCILSQYPDAQKDADKVSVYYTENWEPCAKDNSVYRMDVSPLETAQEHLSCYWIDVVSVDDSENSIYSFEFQLHIPNQPY